MFEDLFDAVSLWWYWSWPTASGQITAIDVERVGRGNHQTWRLAIAYEFWVADDGPYTGEGFWKPAYFHTRQCVPRGINSI